MTVDHILPRSRGGQDLLENLLPACRRCNYSRGNRMPNNGESGSNQLVGRFFGGARTPPTLHELNPPKNVSVSHD